ncbi:peptidoglycan DD-metalloendopeptidase family protein [Pseudoclavibacter helvolus]|uniref:M23 family metallopeptidase n=1 Tax=Pseudoclavibacter helvolus TaxID=255205 RepID=UPI003C77A635
MLIDNLADPQAPVEEIKTRLDTVETQAPMGYSSVTDGQIRIASPEGLWVEGEGGIKLDGRMDAQGVISITGLLELLDGSTLTVKGTASVEGSFTASGTNNLTGTNNLSGPTTVSGTLTGTGDFTLNGVTRLNGNTFITGNSTITGSMTVMSAFTTSGDTTLGGTLTIAGATTVNNTFRTNGAVTVAGSITVTGSASFNSSLAISGAATLSSTLTVNGSIVSGGVTISSNTITVNAGGRSTTIGSVGIQSSYATFQTLEASSTVYFSGLSDVSSVSGLKWLAVTSGGTVVQVPQSVGGPMGDLEWPFDPETNTDEFGPRVSPGGIGSTDHKGMDFGIGVGEGTPIPAAGNGTVVEKGSGGGFGNYLVIQHSGNKRTLYAHMNAPSSLNVGDGVARKQIIGYVGNTGNSTGPHLHFETHIDGVPVNPRTVITKPWSA